MKRSLLVLGLVFYCLLSFGQPAGGGGEPIYDPCNDPDIPPPADCYYDEEGPIDEGVPFLMTMVALFGIRTVRNKQEGGKE